LQTSGRSIVAISKSFKMIRPIGIPLKKRLIASYFEQAHEYVFRRYDIVGSETMKRSFERFIVTLDNLDLLKPKED
jgi:hypothetical protein